MKRLLIPALLAIAAAGLLFFYLQPSTGINTPVAATPMPETPQPDALGALTVREFQDLDAQGHQIRQWIGQPIVINFWATWCAPCVREMPDLERLQQQHPGVRMVGIGIDSADNIRAFLQKIPVTYPILLAGPGGTDLMRTLGNPIGGLPFTLVLNADGSLNRAIIGEINPSDLAATLSGMTPESTHS